MMIDFAKIDLKQLERKPRLSYRLFIRKEAGKNIAVSKGGYTFQTRESKYADVKARAMQLVSHYEDRNAITFPKLTFALLPGGKVRNGIVYVIGKTNDGHEICLHRVYL